MATLRLAAVVLFIFAALGGFGWGVHTAIGTVLGLIAAGLACCAASTVAIPQPPSSR